MSIYTMPPETMPDVTMMDARLERLGQEMAAMIPPPFGADPEALKRHIATSAALTSYGAGLAGHAFGVWLSAVSSSMAMAQRMTEMAVGGHQTNGAEDMQARAAAQAQSAAAADAGIAVVAAVEPKAAEATVKPGRAKAANAKVAAPAGTVVPMAPVAIDRPAAPDDLKAIGGVGPKLEKVLNGYGIWTYGQIAALGEAEILWLDEQLGFPGRVERDDWRGQAAALAGARA